ncbi:MAG TPA: ABC transporter ATP-binding protein [Microbacteriaceae bacterium]|nr:ABC transporter ATP-binding protein [Microbacteriaceae bacterium]
MSSSQVVPSPPVNPGGEGTALILDGVTRRFGGLMALAGVSVILPRGGRLAVIGPNGAGKTTLFRLISGEMRASDGTISLFGEDVSRASERARARRGIARTFQVSNLFVDLSVLDNVRIAAQAGTSRPRRFWWPVSERDAVTLRAKAMLERVGLGSRGADPVADLSHGEQRQLEIAMALVVEPRLLLLDEPAAGLSAAERKVLRRLLEELPEGLSLVLIEHDMSLALELVDHVLCLDNGVPLAYGTPDEIRANPAVQAVYLGRRD